MHVKMKEGPNIARIAALVGDPARAEMLTALMADRALTATELAHVTGLTKQTVSAHLAKLLDAGLVLSTWQGRHRYVRLSGDDVGQLLEALMGVAYRTGAVRVRSGPREPALRKARTCYDHLAGEMGVLAHDGLLRRGWLTESEGSLTLTPAGQQVVSEWPSWPTKPSSRPLCKACLDWSERRHHVGGVLGKALLTHVLDSGWAHRVDGTRAIVFTVPGELAFRALFEC